MPTPRRTAAQKAEALGESITVSYDGAEYIVPSSDDWDISILEHSEAGRLTQALSELLGEEQYAAFRKGHAKLKDLKAFYAVIGKAVGTGNS